MSEPLLDDSWMFASSVPSSHCDPRRANYLLELDEYMRACAFTLPQIPQKAADFQSAALWAPVLLARPQHEAVHSASPVPPLAARDTAAMAHGNYDPWQTAAMGEHHDDQRRGSPVETAYSISSFTPSMPRNDHGYAVHTPDSTLHTGLETGYFPNYYTQPMPQPLPQPLPHNYITSPGIAPSELQPPHFVHPQHQHQHHQLQHQQRSILAYPQQQSHLEQVDDVLSAAPQDHNLNVPVAEEEPGSIAESEGESEDAMPEANEEDDEDSDFRPSRSSRKPSQSQPRRPTSTKKSRSKVAKRPPARGTPTAVQRSLPGLLDQAVNPAERPFTCPALPYGCDTTFTSKNEWKRHVNSQHLCCGYWSCDLCPDQETNPNNFNRKDLFTQHLRRMHAPNKGSSPDDNLRTSKKGKARTPRSFPASKDDQWERQLDNIRKRCWVQSRQPPSQIECAFCRKIFGGSKSIDDWLEHAGQHLIEGTRDQDLASRWQSDRTFRDWLLRYDLVVPDGPYRWKLATGAPAEPLRTQPSAAMLEHTFDGYMEDAEGDPE